MLAFEHTGNNPFLGRALNAEFFELAVFQQRPRGFPAVSALTTMFLEDSFLATARE